MKEKLAKLQNCLDEMITNRSDYRVLRIDQYGTPVVHPSCPALATCMFRVFPQSDKQEALATLPRTISGYALGGYCGQHVCMDFRMVSLSLHCQTRCNTS